jgi:hypothetical protein
VGTCTTIGSNGGGTAQGGGGGTTGGGSGGGDGGVTGGGGGTTGGGGGTTGGGGGTTGGGGGTTGGGGGTTGGGGGATGGGGGTTGGGGGTTGGGGGTTCGPNNCNTCCSTSGQCLTAPNNQNNTTCGSAGNTCFNCTSLNLVCNPNTFSCASPPVGGGGGATGGGGGSTGGGGGATGGGGGGTAIPLAGGETCTSAVILPGPGLYSGTTTSAANNYGSTASGNCVGGRSTGSTGPDVVYRVTVANGQTLFLKVTPESGYDATVNLIEAFTTTNCGGASGSGLSPVCVDGGDDPDEVAYQNTTGVPQTFFVVIDAFETGGSGSYTLEYTLTP